MRNALAVVTLALGIGACTAIFSFVNPLLLHPFTYPRADRLVTIQERDPKGNPAYLLSYPAYRDWTTQTRVLPTIAAFDVGFFFLTGVDDPEQVAGALVTPNLFRTLGVRPALGRDFREGEERVVVLTDACWKHRFGRDPNILGRSIALDWARTPEVERYTVIGVMPPKFWMYYSGFEVFVPLGHSAIREDRRARSLIAIGRLADGATMSQTQGALAAIPTEKDWGVIVQGWERTVTEPLRSELLVLAGGAGLLLLIASANVAGLLLVRAQARRREIAIRAALGASPWRLVALFVRESLWLGLAAALLGILLAWWGVRVILAIRQANLYVMQLSPGLDRIAIDPAALSFAVGAALIACLLAGIVPAMQARKVDVTNALKDTGSAESHRGRKVLVAAEVALSVTLLAGAGLLIKTLQRIHAIDLGYRPDHTLAMRLPVPKTQAADAARTEAYYRDVLVRLAALPQVREAALGEQLPDSADTLPSSGRGPQDFGIAGRADPIRARYNIVTPSYFSTLGIPLLRGRYLNQQDQRRVVISESMARRGWPAGDPVGQNVNLREESLEIVGVVADTRNLLINAHGDRFFAATVVVYRPVRDLPPPAQYFLAVRTSANPLSVARSVREVVRDLGGVVAEMDTMDRFVQNATWQNEQAAGLVGAFAALALILSAVGLYGVIAYAVARRTREIGIRVAVGARRKDVIALVLIETGGPVLVGVIAGIAAALAMGRLLGSLLYRVAPGDPAVLAMTAAAMCVAALAACSIPMLRALRVDPMIALRCD
jgi:putative ABC transport system permease protein